MEKQLYKTPLMEVVEMETAGIIAASVTDDGKAINNLSSPLTNGDASTAVSKGHDIWDLDED